MTYFPDLSPYTYFPAETPGTVNIGWLDRWHAFPTGKTSAKFRAKLERVCQRRVNQTRGFHSCDFCRAPNKPHSSAEMRAQGENRTYAAPSLVHHYVVAHDYKPPKEFIQAVLEFDEKATE
jgi:hypothetical protein